MNFDGKTALVTGASDGVGRATAIELARNGADVALAARSDDKLEALADEVETDFDVEAGVFVTDVSDHEAVENSIENVVESFGGLDIVVNNAGVGQPAPIDELSIDEYRTVIGVNVDGMYFVAKAALPALRESNGNLVFIGSTAGKHVEPGHPLYAATKWWTRGFARNLAGRVGDDGVAVTAINPTAIRSEFGSSFRDPNREVFDEGSVLEPEDVARAVVFAANQDSPVTVSELDLLRRDEFAGVNRF